MLNFFCPHTARIKQQYLNANGVDVLPWPAVSPDLNPIEHICDPFGREVRARYDFNNLQELDHALQGRMEDHSSVGRTTLRQLNETSYFTFNTRTWWRYPILMKLFHHSANLG